MIGRIHLQGIHVHAYHGVSAAEREFGVRCRVDATLLADVTDSALSDDLDDAIDYGAVHDVIVEVARGRSYRLLEALVYAMACEIVARFPACTHVDLTVTKETPVLDGLVDAVGVSLAASRAELRRRETERAARDHRTAGDVVCLPRR